VTHHDDTPPGSGLAERILDRYRQVYRSSREGESLLRYGRRTIPVSTIAQQFYCEKAVQYSIERPRAPTPEMLSGIAGHEAVATLGVTMTPDEAVVEAVATREKPLCIYEFRIGWCHDGVTILGFVDEAWFRGGSVELVAERKFSGRLDFQKPYHVQASLYCLGLGEMGFNTDRCRYRISVFRRECHDCSDIRTGTCPGVALEAQDFNCGCGACVSEEFAFDRDGTLCDLNWALGFWTWEREAEPTAHVSRCRFCRYRRLCEAYRERAVSD
jgi:hypothetical protein